MMPYTKDTVMTTTRASHRFNIEILPQNMWVDMAHFQFTGFRTANSVNNLTNLTMASSRWSSKQIDHHEIPPPPRSAASKPKNEGLYSGLGVWLIFESLWFRKNWEKVRKFFKEKIFVVEITIIPKRKVFLLLFQGREIMVPRCLVLL